MSPGTCRRPSCRRQLCRGCGRAAMELRRRSLALPTTPGRGPAFRTIRNRTPQAAPPLKVTRLRQNSASPTAPSAARSTGIGELARSAAFVRAGRRMAATQAARAFAAEVSLSFDHGDQRRRRLRRLDARRILRVSADDVRDALARSPARPLPCARPEVEVAVTTATSCMMSCAAASMGDTPRLR